MKAARPNLDAKRRPTKPKVRGGPAYAKWTGLQKQPYTDGIHTIYVYTIVGPLTPEEEEHLVDQMDARPRMLRHQQQLSQHGGNKNPIVQVHIRTIRDLHSGRLARFLEPLPEQFSAHQRIYELSDEQRARRAAHGRALYQTPQDNADLAECDRLLSIISSISKPRQNAQKTRKDRFHSILLARYEALRHRYEREPGLNELRLALMQAGAKIERRRYRGADRDVLILYDHGAGREAGMILNTDRALRDSLELAKTKHKLTRSKRLAG